MEEKRYTMEELIGIVRILRRECPWDSVQTHDSLKVCLLEEAYEVLEAIDSGSGEKMADEMGDLLMQILLHAEIGKEQGEYTLEDVTSALANKMIRRHPKIFDKENKTPQNWEEIKKKEKNLGSEAEILENISKYLPALQRSQKFVQKLQKWGKEENDLGRYIEICQEILSNIEKVGNASDAEIGQLLYAVSGLCACLDRSGELILNKFLENFTKTLEK